MNIWRQESQVFHEVGWRAYMMGLVLIWILMPNVIEAFSVVLADGFQLIKQVLRV